MSETAQCPNFPAESTEKKFVEPRAKLIDTQADCSKTHECRRQLTDVEHAFGRSCNETRQNPVFVIAVLATSPLCAYPPRPEDPPGSLANMKVKSCFNPKPKSVESLLRSGSATPLVRD
jgi:hypothetical protein